LPLGREWVSRAIWNVQPSKATVLSCVTIRYRDDRDDSRAARISHNQCRAMAMALIGAVAEGELVSVRTALLP
jgi:hypothetical protein